MYYRSGYQVEQYKSEQDWATREMLEISQAIKCPSIDFHLTTFKKFQQSFCDPAIVKDILGSRAQQIGSEIQEVFQGLWTLEDYQDVENIDEFLKHTGDLDSANSVLKSRFENLSPT